MDEPKLAELELQLFPRTAPTNITPRSCRSCSAYPLLWATGQRPVIIVGLWDATVITASRPSRTFSSRSPFGKRFGWFLPTSSTGRGAFSSAAGIRGSRDVESLKSRRRGPAAEDRATPESPTRAGPAPTRNRPARFPATSDNPGPVCASAIPFW